VGKALSLLDALISISRSSRYPSSTLSPDSFRKTDAEAQNLANLGRDEAGLRFESAAFKREKKKKREKK